MKIFLKALACLVLGTLLWADDPGRDMAREARIEQELTRIAPSQLETFRAGRLAQDGGNAVEAERCYGKVAQAAPFDAAYRRYGHLLVRRGQRAEGLGWCRKAVALRPSADNLSTLAYALAFQEGHAATKAEEVEALGLLLRCRPLPGGREADVLIVTAQLCLQADRPKDFQEAVALLRSEHPALMQAHYFSAISEAMNEHWLRAEQEVQVAQKLGLPKEAAERLLDSGIRSRAQAWHVGYGILVGVGLWVGGLGLLFLVGFVLSRLTLRRAYRVTEAVSPLERRLRAVYRHVLNLTGIYYYLSLPVVLVLVVAIAGGIIYGFLMIGQIPVKLVLLLGLGALMTVWAMLKSLTLKVEEEDPGRALAREEAEGLWQLTEEVARTLGTRPIDEIRLTPGTDLAVYERGSWRDKLRNRSRRVLILGAALVHGFKQDDFRCVLAHEYGHFSHRDTAGGEVALRVRRDMWTFFHAMAEAGQATWLNVAFHFLRFYNFIYRRISHGATRLQEILADRVAATTYGALALEGGLRHVIHRSLTFDRAANREIQEALETKRPLQNLYEIQGAEAETVQEDFEQILQRETTADDTHPSPKDRFRLVAGLPPAQVQPREGEVWDLFRDPEAIQRELMSGFESHVAPYRSHEDRTGRTPAGA